MVDIQNTADTREVPLEKVGVKNVKYPLQVLDKANSVQNTTASVNLFVNLPHNFKGTHMSRFIQVFHKYHKDSSMLSARSEESLFLILSKSSRLSQSLRE